MPTDVQKNADGSVKLTVTRVETEETLQPHQIISRHITLKRHLTNLQREVALAQDQVQALSPILAQIASDQVLLREAEIARIQSAKGMVAHQGLFDEQSWWSNLYTEVGGDAQALAKARKAARDNATDATYTNADKMSTPRS